MRLLHPWSDDLIRCAAAAAAGKRSSQLAQGTSRRLRAPAFDKDKAIRHPPAKTPARHRLPMYNYASPLPPPKRQTKPRAELLHVMNSAILCWPIQAGSGA